MIIEFLFFILSLTVYLILKEKYKYFERLGIPYEKPFFLVGNGWKMLLGLENLGTFLSGVYRRNPHNKVVGIFHGIKPAVVVRDPELGRLIMVKEFSNFPDRGITIDEELNPIEGHLFNLSGYKWRLLRYHLSPTFTTGKIKAMLCHMDRCVQDFIVALETKHDKIVDMKLEFTKLTAQVIGSCTFGIETESIKNEKSDFIRLAVMVIQPNLKEFLMNVARLFWPRLIKALKLRTVKKEVNEFFLKLVKETMEYRQSTGYFRNDFLQLLLQLRNKGQIQLTSNSGSEDRCDGSSKTLALTDSILTAQAAVFLAAGFETTSTTLSFICYELSRNPEVQEKARTEVINVKARFGEFSYSALKEMHYLDAVINEGLRLWPPVQGSIRVCNKTTRIGEFIIEKGVMIHITTQDNQRDPVYFSQPLTFKPERFTEESISNYEYAFLPFGDGPRNCIGERFARLELKITLANLLNKFKLDRCAKMDEMGPIKFKVAAFTNVPAKPIYCVLNKVDN